MLNVKMFQLIKLMAGESQPITSSMLADQLKLSARTCKRYIADLIPLLKDHGAAIHADKYGYHLIITDNHRFEQFLREKTKVFEFSENSNELQFEILKTLLVHPTLSQTEMIDSLYISRSTLNKLMVEVKKTLKANGIRLANRPYYGYYLTGDEIDIRNFMVKTLFVTPSALSIEPELSEIAAIDAEKMYHQIAGILKAQGIAPKDDLIHYSLKYLIVSLYRIANGAQLYLHTEELQKTLLPAVQKAASEILNLFQTRAEFSEQEMLYFASLIGNRTQDLNVTACPTADNLKALVEDMLASILNICRVDFRHNEILKKALTAHLYASLSRYYLKATLPNPLITLIKSQYVEAYNYSLICCEILKEKIQLAVNDDDIGYIALHFAAALEKEKAHAACRAIIVCGFGIGTSELIRIRLSQLIPTLTIQAVLSSFELEDQPLESIDFLITTVPLPPVVLPRPAIQISPMITAEDIRKIEFMINNYQSLHYLRSLFRNELFFPGIEGATKQEALDNLTSKMLQTGLISEAFVTAIKEREAMSSTEITEQTAIPHCFLSIPIDTMLAIGILKQPVPWGKARVQLLIVGIINPSVKKNKCVFPMIYRLIHNPEKVQRLIAQTTPESFMQILFENIETEI